MPDAAPRPRSLPDPRFDPWSGYRFGGLHWFAFSTAFHVGLLFLLATVTLTVIRKAQEVRVKVVDEVGPDEFEGAPSLQDLAGVLKMENAVPHRAAVSGPVIRGVRPPEMPHIGGVGPKTHSFRPPDSEVRATSALATTSSPGSVTTVSAIGDFTSGRSKQGKIFRAPVGSHWLVRA